MKATGDAAHIFSNEVFGGIDLTDMLLLDRMRAWGGATAATPAAVTTYPLSAGSAPTGPQPGEVWYVYSAALKMAVTAAATSIKLAFVVERINQTGALSYQYLTPMLSLGASSGGFVSQEFPKPIIMQSGDVLRVQCLEVTGAPGIIPAVYLYYATIGV